MPKTRDDIKDSISGLYEGRRAFLCFYAMRYVNSFQEAEDIVQSVFEKLLSSNLMPENLSSFDSYVISAVRNSSLNYLAQKKTHGKYSSYILNEERPDDEDGFLTSRIEAEVFWEIFSKVEKLPEGCRQVFRMSYLENFSNQEIAERLGISVNTVKSQKARAKELLRESLKDLFSIAALLFGL